VTTEQDAIRAAAGLDASRRVGWARYFDAVEANAALREAMIGAVANTIALCLQVQHHNRLPHDDVLVLFATEFLNDIGSTPEGHRLIEAIRAVVL